MSEEARAKMVARLKEYRDKKLEEE